MSVQIKKSTILSYARGIEDSVISDAEWLINEGHVRFFLEKPVDANIVRLVVTGDLFYKKGATLSASKNLLGIHSLVGNKTFAKLEQSNPLIGRTFRKAIVEVLEHADGIVAHEKLKEVKEKHKNKSKHKH